MALCKNCGHEVTEGDLICTNCGKPLADDVFDMDAKPLQGSYIMPGSPGYVPFDGIKVMMQEEGKPEAHDEKVAETIEQPKTETVVEEKVVEEKIVDEKPQEETIEPEIKDVPPAKETTFGSTTGEAKAPEPSTKRASDSGAYTPPKQNFNVPPAPPQNSSGSGKKFPIKAIGIGVVALLVLFFLFGRGKGSKISKEAEKYVGHWISFAEEFDGMYYDADDNPDIGKFAIDLNKDGSFKLDVGREFEGEWELKDGVIELAFEDGSDETLHTLPEVIDLVLGESTIYFSNGKDSEFKTSILQAIESQKAVRNATEENVAEAETPENNENTEAPAPAENTEFAVEDLYGEYEGVLYEEKSWGSWESEEPFRSDIVGLIDRDTNTDLDFFEAYLEGEENPFVSMFIELDDFGITPIIEEGAEDAFFYTRWLLPEEAKYFTKEINSYPPTLKFKYKFIDPEDSESGVIANIILKPVGSSWDGEEIKPSGY